MQVADMSRLQVAVLVNETRIGRVRVGQPAATRFDALVSQEFQGKVSKVNRIPEPTTYLDGNVKKYKVFITIENPSPLLRIGMTAMVEIK